MDNTKQEILTYCSAIGVDRDFIQGAGGNVSWKEEGVLWVKASGTWLADAESDDIFVPVDLSTYRREINNGNLSVTPPLINGEKSRRASIETLFHAIFPHQVSRTRPYPSAAL